VRAQNLYHRFADFATVPTIPGKFETVLYKGNQEEKGFGSQTPRFGQEPRPAAPGPGAYSCRGLAPLQGLVLASEGTALLHLGEPASEQCRSGSPDLVRMKPRKQHMVFRRVSKKRPMLPSYVQSP